MRFWFILIASWLLLLVLVISKVQVPVALGAAAIVLFAAASLIPFTSVVLIYPTYRFRLPSLVLIVLLLAGVFSLWNDNHQVRTVTDGQSVTFKRASFREHLDKWLAERNSHYSKQASYPVFIVAAEGGGVRAAYWTARVLAALQDRFPEFSCNLFAISGVSGGSLGAAVFAGLLKNDIDEGRFPCGTAESGLSEDYKAQVEKVLQFDAISPTLAGLLFPDLVQRFSPVPGGLGLGDRAEYLELAWEAGWREGVCPGTDAGDIRCNRFAERFGALWDDNDKHMQLPSLVFNGAWVETGGRAVTSNIKLVDSAVTEDFEEFVNLKDADVLDKVKEPIRLSTAVHMSARFTYISPAGTVEDEKARRIVDGGYYENSGGLTATDMIQAMGVEARKGGESCIGNADKGGGCAYPVAIIISNNHNSPNNPEKDADNLSWIGRIFHRAFPELLSPVRALFSTHDARGFDAEREFRASVPPRSTFRFQLQGIGDGADGSTQGVALGWMLSSETREAMNTQADNLIDRVELLR